MSIGAKPRAADVVTAAVLGGYSRLCRTGNATGPQPGPRVAVAARHRGLSRGVSVAGTAWDLPGPPQAGGQRRSAGAWEGGRRRPEAPCPRFTWLADWGGAGGWGWGGWEPRWGGYGHTVDNSSRTGPRLPCDMTDLITSWWGLAYHPILPLLPEGRHTPGASEGCFRTSPDGAWLVVLSPGRPTTQNESGLRRAGGVGVNIIERPS